MNSATENVKKISEDIQETRTVMQTDGKEPKKVLTPEEQEELAKKLAAVLLLHLNIEKEKITELGKEVSKGTLDEDAVIEALTKGSAGRLLPIKDITAILANSIEKEPDKYSQNMQNWANVILKSEDKSNNSAITINAPNPLGIEALVKLMEKKEKEELQKKEILEKESKKEILQGEITEKEQTKAPKQEQSTADIIDAAKITSRVDTALSADGRSAINGVSPSLEQQMGIDKVQKEKSAVNSAMKAINDSKAQGDPPAKKYLTFTPNDKDVKPVTGLYAGQGRDKNGKETAILKCGNTQIAVYPDKGNLTDVTLKHDKELRDIHKGLKVALKEVKQQTGTTIPVHFARNRGTFEGEILATTSKFAIQEVQGLRGNSLVLHLVSDISGRDDKEKEKIQKGNYLSITKGNSGVTVDSKTKQEKERERNEKQRYRQSKQISSRNR